MSAKIDCQLRQVCLSVFLSAWKNCATTGRNFVKCNIYIYIYVFLKFCPKFKRDWIMRRKPVMCMKMYNSCGYGNIGLYCYQNIQRVRENWYRNSKHILYSVNTLQSSVFHEIMCKKDGRPKQAIDYNIIRQRNNALCILCNWGNTHTHRLCHACWFSTPTMVKRTRLWYPICAVHVIFSNMLTEQLIRNLNTLHTHQHHAAVI